MSESRNESAPVCEICGEVATQSETEAIDMTLGPELGMEPDKFPVYAPGYTRYRRQKHAL